MKMEETLNQELLLRKHAGLNRKLQLLDNGIDFCSNDYLGLANSNALKSSILDECKVAAWASGSTGSRLVSGNHSYIEHLEDRIGQMHHAEAALIFPNGYMANLGIYSTLANRGDTYIYDEHVHASIIDGCRLSFANRKKFQHNNVSQLEELLSTIEGKKWVIVESIYSMLGDRAPLKELSELVKRHDAELIVDEAHATGLYGYQGAGCVCANQLEENVSARVITYGKAFGVSGAAVLGSKTLKAYLINHSRPFIYSTAPSPSLYVAIEVAYDYVSKMDSERDRLKELRLYLNQKLFKDLPNANQEDSAICFIHWQGNDNVLEMQQKLKEQGLNLIAMREPTVPKGKEGFRLCLHAFNTCDEIDLLSNKLIEE